MAVDDGTGVEVDGMDVDGLELGGDPGSIVLDVDEVVEEVFEDVDELDGIGGEDDVLDEAPAVLLYTFSLLLPPQI